MCKICFKKYYPLYWGKLSSLPEKMSPTVRIPPKQIFFLNKISLKENCERKRNGKIDIYFATILPKWNGKKDLFRQNFAKIARWNDTTAVLGMQHRHSKSKLHVHFQAAHPCPYCRAMSVLHVHVHAAWACPCGMSQYMLHVHVLAACPCQCCMLKSMQLFHVNAACSSPCC